VWHYSVNVFLDFKSDLPLGLILLLSCLTIPLSLGASFIKEVTGFPPACALAIALLTPFKALNKSSNKYSKLSPNITGCDSYNLAFSPKNIFLASIATYLSPSRLMSLAVTPKDSFAENNISSSLLLK
jgi:hypothetical protein